MAAAASTRSYGEELRHRSLAIAYVLWALAVFFIVFAKDGLRPDNVTHVGIGVYLALSVVAIPLLRRLADRYPVPLVFVAACCISAAVVETCYMISGPLHPTLVITRDTGVTVALRNLGVDLALTLPAYVVIFAVVWTMVRHIEYGAVEVAILFSAGQAIGDAMAFFQAQPQMLLFLPFVMLNYQAMTLIPFIALRDRVPPAPRRSAWIRIAVPLVILPLIYGIVGTMVILSGKALGAF